MKKCDEFIGRTNVVIDWLQINCAGILKFPQTTDFKTLEYGTKVFCTVTEVYKFGELFATMAYNPRSSTLKKDMILIKFTNKYLYRNSQYIEGNGTR